MLGDLYKLTELPMLGDRYTKIELQGNVIYAAKAHLFDSAGISFCRTRC